MPWSSSDRRARLPKDWAKRVAACKRLARGRCQAEHHEPECDGIGAECDHRDGTDDHSLANLQWLSEPCHLAKTLSEASAARTAMLAKASHPRERPFGLR